MSGKDKWVRRFSVDETAKHKNGFTIYKITSVLFPIDAPEAVTVVSVWKRYSDVRRLHRSMCALHAGLHLPPRGTCTLPSTSYFRRFQKEVIEERAKAIKRVLEFIAEHRLLFTSTEFVHFLQSGYPAPSPTRGAIESIRAALRLAPAPPLPLERERERSPQRTGNPSRPPRAAPSSPSARRCGSRPRRRCRWSGSGSAARSAQPSPARGAIESIRAALRLAPAPPLPLERERERSPQRTGNPSRPPRAAPSSPSARRCGSRPRRRCRWSGSGSAARSAQPSPARGAIESIRAALRLAPAPPLPLERERERSPQRTGNPSRPPRAAPSSPSARRCGSRPRRRCRWSGSGSAARSAQPSPARGAIESIRAALRLAPAPPLPLERERERSPQRTGNPSRPPRAAPSSPSARRCGSRPRRRCRWSGSGSAARSAQPSPARGAIESIRAALRLAPAPPLPLERERERSPQRTGNPSRPPRAAPSSPSARRCGSRPRRRCRWSGSGSAARSAQPSPARGAIESIRAALRLAPAPPLPLERERERSPQRTGNPSRPPRAAPSSPSARRCGSRPRRRCRWSGSGSAARSAQPSPARGAIESIRAALRLAPAPPLPLERERERSPQRTGNPSRPPRAAPSSPSARRCGSRPRRRCRWSGSGSAARSAQPSPARGAIESIRAALRLAPAPPLPLERERERSPQRTGNPSRPPRAAPSSPSARRCGSRPRRRCRWSGSGSAARSAQPSPARGAIESIRAALRLAPAPPLPLERERERSPQRTGNPSRPPRAAPSSPSARRCGSRPRRRCRWSGSGSAARSAQPSPARGAIESIRAALRLAPAPPLPLERERERSPQRTDQPETRDETDFASIPQIPIYEAAVVEIKPHSSTESLNSLESLNDDLYDQLSKLTVQNKSAVKNKLPDLINFDAPSSSRLENYVPKQSETSSLNSTLSSRSNSRMSLYSKASLSNVDSKTRTEDSYVFEAGYLLNMAARCEDMREYRRAFDFYKSGIEKMLVGVQTDSDPQRRALIKEKTNKYLSYAEEIYKNHLCDAHESLIPEPEPTPLHCPVPLSMLRRPYEDLALYRVLAVVADTMMLVLHKAEQACYAMKVRHTNAHTPALYVTPTPIPLHCPVPLSMLRRPYEELALYRVLSVVADTMMLVLHKAEQACYAMKVIQKIPNNLTEFDEYFLQRTNETRQPVLPTSIPYMVPLHAYIETNSLIFLILTYAPGEKLLDYIKNYAKSIPSTPAREVNLENVFSEPMKKVEEVKEGDEVEELVKNSQTLLKNVDRALREEEEVKEENGREESPTHFRLTPMPRCVLPPSAVRSWAAQILTALESLHNAGVICRDLNPSNILLGDGGQVILTYFAGYPPDVSLPQRSLSMSSGRIDLFVAPELYNVCAEIGDERLCDFWSFGVIMYELLCGVPLSHYHKSVFTSHTVLCLPEELPVEEESLLTQLLTYNPAERLGRDGVDEIKQHPYFRHTDWTLVQNDWRVPG
ncbi:uncharacterized protein LOC134679553 [Cydia fagiglandana]|uniref:uncharacterized protein LOC134679553 n=1 Tax=Cydia fagiglandana TaxID=1458189 RepID=UPI002FEE2EC9